MARRVTVSLHSNEGGTCLGAHEQSPRGLVQPVAVEGTVQGTIVALRRSEDVRQRLPHAPTPTGPRVFWASASVDLKHKEFGT